MTRLLAAFLLSLTAITGVSHAQEVTRQEFNVDVCKYGTIDGSQVFVMAFLDGDCVGKPKVFLYIADFKLGAICSVTALKCIKVANMTEEQLNFYHELTLHRSKTINDPKVCTQYFGDWVRFEMITGKKAGCSPSFNGARSFDKLLKQGCVYLAQKRIDCIEYTDEEFKRLLIN